MTIKELIELAPAYALKTLDDEQDAKYARSLDAASPAIQSQVWDVIARTLGGLEGTLPGVKAPPQLRPRVAGAVASAIATDVLSGSVDVVARVGPGSRRVSPVWRAAAIGCAAAAVVFGLATFQMQSRYSELDSAIRNNQLASMFAKDFGARFETAFFSPKSEFVKFASTATDGSTPAEAILVIDRERQTAQLICKGLPRSEAGVRSGMYTLATIDAEGRVGETVLNFQVTDMLTAKDIVNMPLEAGTTLAILPVGENAKPMLRSTNL